MMTVVLSCAKTIISSFLSTQQTKKQSLPQPSLNLTFLPYLPVKPISDLHGLLLMHGSQLPFKWRPGNISEWYQGPLTPREGTQNLQQEASHKAKDGRCGDYRSSPSAYQGG